MLPPESGQEGNGCDETNKPSGDQIIASYLIELKALVQEYKANNAQTTANEAKRSIRERWTLGGILIYTIITAGIAYIGMRQFTLAQSQERVQLRPYAMVRVDSVSPMTPGTRMAFRVTVDNVGTTPVYNGKLHPLFSMSSDYSLHKPVPSCQTDTDPAHGSDFGKTTSYSFESDEITQSQIDLIKGGAASYVFVGRYCYTDVFKEVNWTDVCLYWHSEKGEIESSYCGYFNEVVSDGGGAPWGGLLP